MIPCPIKNTVTLGVTVKPKITQRFGANPQNYSELGLKGHEGIDFRAPIKTEVHSPIDGVVVFKYNSVYGTHAIITNDRLRVILAHLSFRQVKSGSTVNVGELVALSGNSGNSKAPHLHMVLQVYKNGKVVNKNNGFAGGFDFEPFLMYWNF